MVDSNDRERIDTAGYSGSAEDTAKGALYTMLADEAVQGVPLLVLANKQDLIDLPNTVSVDEVKDRLALNDINDREWKIMGSCAITGEGLWEGLDWALSADEGKLFYNGNDLEVGDVQQDQGGGKKATGKSVSSSVKSFFTRFARKK